ncbi:hypothetical protein SAY86_024062 [Trapa natans]|uniref:Uncharacterized protein n=1 Tax=Trapa natans TaxID=22666 RepID=A0AAN7M8Q0_TRANT|nr:hypothetical protein SAY86_024062 [Trapa natans]
MSQTMCTRSSACSEMGPDPPFPISQYPTFATRTPAQAASAQPHQYVTPSTPQTGSVRKHLTGHDAGRVDQLLQMPSLSSFSDDEGNLRAEEENPGWDRTEGTEERTKAVTIRMRVREGLRRWFSIDQPM